jgi:hypothetical protein
MELGTEEILEENHQLQETIFSHLLANTQTVPMEDSMNTITLNQKTENNFSFIPTPVRGAPSRTIEKRNIEISPVHNFLEVDDRECQNWVPGVTGPYGWYDVDAVVAFNEVQAAQAQRVEQRFMFIPYSLGLSFAGYAAWYLTTQILPILFH